MRVLLLLRCLPSRSRDTSSKRLSNPKGNWLLKSGRLVCMHENCQIHLSLFRSMACDFADLFSPSLSVQWPISNNFGFGGGGGGAPKRKCAQTLLIQTATAEWHKKIRSAVSVSFAATTQSMPPPLFPLSPPFRLRGAMGLGLNWPTFPFPFFLFPLPLGGVPTRTYCGGKGER